MRHSALSQGGQESWKGHTCVIVTWCCVCVCGGGKRSAVGATSGPHSALGGKPDSSQTWPLVDGQAGRWSNGCLCPWPSRVNDLCLTRLEQLQDSPWNKESPPPWPWDPSPDHGWATHKLPPWTGLDAVFLFYFRLSSNISVHVFRLVLCRPGIFLGQGFHLYVDFM